MSAFQAHIVKFLYGVRELCWLYALAALAIEPQLNTPIPIIGMAIVFFAATLLAGASPKYSWTAQTRLLTTCGASLSATIFILQATIHSTEPFWQGDWLIAFMTWPKGFLEVVAILLIVGWTGLLVWSGLRLQRYPLRHKSAVDRFDKGLGLLVAFLLLKTLFVTQCGAAFPDVKLAVIWIYFAASLLGIVLSEEAPVRPQAHGRELMRIGVLVVLLVGLLLGATLVTAFSRPGMMATAASSFAGVQRTLRPVGPFATEVIKALVKPSRKHFEAMGDEYRRQPQKDAYHSGAWLAVVNRTGGLLLSIILFMGGCYGLLSAILFLKRWWYRIWCKQYSPSRQFPSVSWRAWLRKAYRRMRAIHQASPAQRYYRRLEKWGRINGVPRSPAATPAEYGHRLAHYFPTFEEEIKNITVVYLGAIYGGHEVSPHQMGRLERDWRRLKHPVQWPVRALCRLRRLRKQYIRQDKSARTVLAVSTETQRRWFSSAPSG